jgi:hypothetical protein
MASLWQEYVLTLHRLGWDRPWHLPEPPESSDFHPVWNNPPYPRRNDHRTIYHEKFQAYYGKYEPDKVRPVSADSLFPVFLATAVFAVGWTAVLWDTAFLTSPAGTWDVLKYGFAGAYAFATGMLMRRYFQADLRPSAYTSSIMRIVLVLLIVAVVHQALAGTELVAVELAVAFVIGFFPIAGLALINRVAARVLGRLVHPLTPPYPLDQLDGLNLWYEVRLLEEGVEDLQNLTTMNMVDVVLHTRVPPGRLVDWLDQALLLLHLDARTHREGEGAAPEPGAPLDSTAARHALRRVGIRTATDLLKVYSRETRGVRTFVEPDTAHPPLPVDQLRSLVTVLGQEPKLTVVWNWQRGGVCPYPIGAPEQPPPPGGPVEEQVGAPVGEPAPRAAAHR